MSLPEIIVYLQQEELFPNKGIITEEEFDKLFKSAIVDMADRWIKK